MVDMESLVEHHDSGVSSRDVVATNIGHVLGYLWETNSGRGSRTGLEIVAGVLARSSLRKEAIEVAIRQAVEQGCIKQTGPSRYAIPDGVLAKLDDTAVTDID